MTTMALNIRMDGKEVVVVGGGAVALRKIRSLQEVGASVRVVAITACPEIIALKSAGVPVRLGSYTGTDLDGAFLVIAATDDFRVNQQVAFDARARRMLVSVSDNPEAGDCTFPALLQRGDLQVAVSTGGRCPAFAVEVRNRIAGHIGHEYGDILEQLSGEREKLLTNGSPSTYNTQVLRTIARNLLAGFTDRKESLS